MKILINSSILNNKKIICSANDTKKKVEKRALGWENTFVMSILRAEVSKINKQLLQINKIKTNSITEK